MSEKSLEMYEMLLAYVKVAEAEVSMFENEKEFIKVLERIKQITNAIAIKEGIIEN